MKKDWTKISFVYIFLCVCLIWLSKTAQDNQDLLRAWILLFTSNILTIVYLFGFRNYVRNVRKKEESDKENKIKKGELK